MRIAVFASGGGTNFQALIDAVQSGRLASELALCVSNKADSGALSRAERHGIPTLAIDPRDYEVEAVYVNELLGELDRLKVDCIALAGYLRKIPGAVVARFERRILNIHPALLPAFGGPGMYGLRVHRAVLESGAEFSGATVHFVDEEYDSGPILLQDTVPVLDGDTPEDLAARVLTAEHRIYPAAIRLLERDMILFRDGHALIQSPSEPTNAP